MDSIITAAARALAAVMVSRAGLEPATTALKVRFRFHPISPDA